MVTCTQAQSTIDMSCVMNNLDRYEVEYKHMRLDFLLSAYLGMSVQRLLEMLFSMMTECGSVVKQLSVVILTPRSLG